MGLIRLEMDNFKSYKGRQTIGPFTRFSAVIGPNGAGKSNLMDAISFVLGIKARELRGTNFKDLIYGANSGHPVAERASVTAVFKKVDDDDSPEIRFTRAITGKGTTEYRIDRKVVTWEVYNARLASFDILVKARNFLVFQGDVEAIAQKNPKQITQLFETVSGSEELKEEYEKLKKEKQEAEERHQFVQQKKKGFTAEKKQYKEQKEEAERFKRLQHDLARCKSQHVLWQLRHIENDVAETTAALKGNGKALEKLSARRKTVEAQLKTKKQEAAAQQKQIDLQEKAVGKQEKVLEAQRPRMIATKEELTHTRERVAGMREDLRKKEQAQGDQGKKLAGLQRELQDVQRAADRFEQAAQEESQAGQVELEAGQMEEYNRLKDTASQATGRHRQEMEKVTRNQTAAAEARERARTKSGELNERKAQLQKEHAKMSERLGKFEKLAGTYDAQLATLVAETEALNRAIAEGLEKQQRLQDRLNTVTASLSQARAEHRESARARKFNEALESMKRLYPGIHGRLIDLCKPVNKRYHVALTVIMGKNMDAIVVDTEKVGMDCMQYLRQERVGIATFIPLDTIIVPEINERLRHLGGTTKLVVDVIDYDAAYQKAVLYACGNAVVCDSEEEAKKLSFEQNVSKTVSLDGTVIRSSGTMEGGLGGVEGKAHRWEEKHIETLRQEREQCQDELQELRALRKQQLQKEKNDSQIQGFRSRRNFMETDIKLEQNRLKANEEEQAVLQQELAKLEPELERSQEEAAQLDAEADRLRQAINVETDKVFAAFCRSLKLANIREYEEKVLLGALERSRRRTEFRKQIDALRAQVEYESSRDLTEAVEKLKAAVKELQATASTLEAEGKKLETAVANETVKLDSLRGRLKELQSEAEDKQVEIKELKKALSDCVSEAGHVQKEVNAHETQLDQLRARRHALFKQCKLEDIALPLLRGTLDVAVEESATAGSVSATISGATLSSVDVDTLNTDIAQRLHEKEAAIAVDYSLLPKDLGDEEPDEREGVEQQFTDKMRQIQAEIDSIAPNMKAMERLDDVRERLKESADEFEHTLKASQEASRMFEEVKQQRITRFMGAFQHISAQIDEIYKALTQSGKLAAGGTAFLNLEDPDEPYLAGIKYTAMPPLKRFRDMDQLSGGERTVAALALLFAIHSFQPAPFFVLDEVDAALDNNNVRSVARYIDSRTSSSFQCIVISLKDIFYEKSNSLVGILRDRAEDCSRTLTVDLSKYADEEEQQ